MYGTRDWYQQTKSICSYDCQNFYSLTCPKGKNLAIRQLNYGAKPHSDQCPADAGCFKHDRCCSYEQGDCLQEFSDQDMHPIFNECSGKQQCGWLKAPTIDVKNTCQFRRQSNYIVARIDCINGRYWPDVRWPTVLIYCTCIPIRCVIRAIIGWYSASQFLLSDFNFNMFAEI